MRNQFLLDATLAKKDKLRRTPAGLPVLDLVLSHQSEQGEPLQKVWVEIEAVAIGALADEMKYIEIGQALSIKGYLNRKHRATQYLQLHITQFKI